MTSSFLPQTKTPAQLLADATQKLHDLRTGRLSVEVEVEGRRVRYAKTDEDKLVAYIKILEQAVNGAPAPRFGAIGFLF